MRSFTQQQARECFKKARRVLKHPGLDILVAPRAQDIAGILAVTPRRVGNAPQRNKIRRQLKAIFHEEKLSEQEFDCIVIVKQPAIGMPFLDLKELVVSTIKNLTPPVQQNA